MGSLSENFNASCGCLYSKGKQGEIRSWRVSTEGGSIIVVHGRLNGVLQTVVKQAKGKNIGRANETTPAVQAVLQAKSMHKKQMDKGYFSSVEEAETRILLRPMLAAKFDEKKHKVLYPCSVQPKFDGNRCLCYWENGEIKLMSRGGKAYDVQHIADACKNHLPKGKVFDGELYIHGVALQDITGMIKKPKPESVNLEYHIYDMFSTDDLEKPWSDRLIELEAIWDGFSAINPLKEVLTVGVSSEAQALQMEIEFVAEGFEGAIVRGEAAPYLLGKRSDQLLKIKSFQDDEFRIVGFLEGEGKFEGCIIFECVTDSGRTFKAVPKGSLDQKRDWFEHGESYIGKLLKVKYFQLTNDGIPQHPVGLTIRLEEDL